MPVTPPSSPLDEASVKQALAEQAASKVLSEALGRIGKLLGLNVAAMRNDSPGKCTVALAILGEDQAAVVVTSKTREGALLNSAGFLHRISKAVEQRLASKHPPKPPVEHKPLPNQELPKPGIVRRIGG